MLYVGCLILTATCEAPFFSEKETGLEKVKPLTTLTHLVRVKAERPCRGLTPDPRSLHRAGSEPERLKIKLQISQMKEAL